MDPSTIPSNSDQGLIQEFIEVSLCHLLSYYKCADFGSIQPALFQYQNKSALIMTEVDQLRLLFKRNKNSIKQGPGIY